MQKKITMNIHRFWLIMLGILVGVSPGSLTVMPTPMARAQTTRRELQLSQTGSGIYSVNSRFQESITAASINVDSSGNAELTFWDSRENPVKLTGNIARETASGLEMTITGATIPGVIGTANIRYNSHNEISSIFVAGTIEGQRFSINFSQ
ncbi:MULTISPECIES: hypothetical protein [Limnospira]|nr:MULTISPECIES: hypothetical protein [Limnospira]